MTRILTALALLAAFTALTAWDGLGAYVTNVSACAERGTCEQEVSP